MNAPPVPIPAQPGLTLTLDGGTRALVLREAETREVLPLILDSDLRYPSLVQDRLVLELLSLIDTIDGALPSQAQAEAIARSPELLAAVCQARNAYYDRLIGQGRALAACPHCPRGEVTLDLLFYWLVLGLPPYRLFDDGVLMGHPSLADPLPAGWRPDSPPRARSLGFSYPADPPLAAALRSLAGPGAAARESAAWQRYAPDGVEPDDEHWHWRRGNTGFRAILRLSLGLTWPDGREATPDEVDRLPVGAYLFLDLLHFATSNVDVRDLRRLTVRCPTCGGAFLPVLGPR
jgi:hypothetical protein